MPTAIPFNRPFILSRELEYMADAVQSGRLSGGGKYSRLCERWLSETLGIGATMLTPSCTAALEMAAVLLDIGPGDEIIMPSYTFVSTANAFALRGARPVFVDVESDTLNISPSAIAEAITPKTKAIVPVHYAGVGCDMVPIMALAQQHGIRVIEDAAQGVFAWRDGRALGGWGDLACFSFHETKNFMSGEGGALVVNDPALHSRAEIVREKGTNRSQFFKGLTDKYTWVDLGSSFLPSELAAAFLFAQLEHAEEITRRRLTWWDVYHAAFEPLEKDGLLRRPIIPASCRHNAHLYYLLCATPEERDGLLAYLNGQQIGAVFHYVPLHKAPMARTLGLDEPVLPVTEALSARLIRLPLYYDLGVEDQSRVIAAVHAFYRRG